MDMVWLRAINRRSTGLRRLALGVILLGAAAPLAAGLLVATHDAVLEGAA